MFDHIEPKIRKPVALHHHISLFFMMASSLSLIFIFALPLVSFTQTVRPEVTVPSQVSIWLEPRFTQARSVVVPQNDFELARYVLKVSDQSAKLLALHFTVDGVGELTQLDPVRLYLDEVQVGTGQPVSEQGAIVFRLANTLPAGSHTVALRSGWKHLAQGQLFKVALLTAKDLQIVQQDKIVEVNSILPLTTETISFTDKGALQAVNNPILHIATISNTIKPEQSDVIFKLDAAGETIDIKRLNFNARSKDFSFSEIQLLLEDKVIKRWTDSNDFKNSIDLVLPLNAVSVAPGRTTELRFRLLGLVQQEKAQVQVQLNSVIGLGFVSNQEIIWRAGQPLIRAKTFSRDQLAWTLATSADSYALVVQTKSGQSLTIQQATLELQADQATIPDSWNVLVDGRIVAVEIPLIQSTKIVFRFPNSLVMSSGQIITFKPISKTSGGASVRLIPEQLQWQSNNQTWFSSADEQPSPAPATHIRW